MPPLQALYAPQPDVNRLADACRQQWPTRAEPVAAQELRAIQPPLDGLPDARVSTVTPGSQRLLDRVGAWQHCAPVAAAFSDMQARAPVKRPFQGFSTASGSKVREV